MKMETIYEMGRIKQAVEDSPSMSAFARLVECDYKTFRKWAKLYGYCMTGVD